MDCNKEEALRLQALAESKMSSGDFVGAQKLLLKAQSLFSGLESLSKMLAVCDVHSSAGKTINGLQNWYGILQVLHLCDDATIKKQYKKLALLLHPDKNQFAGAETAFVLIGEASKLLSDKEKRLQYDIKYRIYSRARTQKLNSNSGLQCAAANNANGSTISNATFLTCCEHCGYMHKYLRHYVNTHMFCSNCKKSFMAYNTGFNGVTPKSSTGQEEVRDQGPCNASAKINVESNGSQPVCVAAEVDKEGTSKEKIIKKNGRDDESKDSEVRKSKTEDVSTKNDAESSNILGVESSKGFDFGGSSSLSHAKKSKAKENVESVYQEISSPKDKKVEGCEARGEGMSMDGKINNNHKANEKPMNQDMPDPEFNNFELTASCFVVNQVWSLYNPTDGMPRLYARIDKVLDYEFKLCITWIDPLRDNKGNSVPVACGVFQEGESEEVDDILIFSSQMLYVPHESNIIIYPSRGEIWAIFRGWDISWTSSLENHTKTFEYDYVEVLADFKDEIGLGVAYLGKVEGFVSLFRRDAQQGVLQFQISPSEMLRFSHKVPSFKMTGNEREGVPPGCFELDTAALPTKMFQVDNSKVDAEVKVQANNTLKKTPSSKKRQKVYDGKRHTSDEMNSVKKSRKSVKEVDDLKLRKSPRLLSKNSNQATSRTGKEKYVKKSANDGESCGQRDGFRKSDQKTASSKKPEKVIVTNSSTNRKTHRDVHKPTGTSKKRGRSDESLSQCRGNGLPTRSNGGIISSDTETSRLENTFNFENQRSQEKFQIDQIWAIYSNDKGMPRKYAQIKRIDSSPEFKLHVALLELSRPLVPMTHTLCCGRFKLKTGKAEVLVPSSFSHQVKAVKINWNRFEIYPGKGEIWALYKNWNNTDCIETDEVEIVEVVETDEQSIQAVPLTDKGFKKPLYGRSQEPDASPIDIPKAQVSRFSHQIPALTRSGDRECWELDLKAVPDLLLIAS